MNERYQINIFVFSLYCLISAIWSWDTSKTVSMAITLFEILICMSCVYPFYARQETIDPMLKAIMWTGFIVTIYSFAYYGSGIIGAITGGFRLENGFNNINVLGMTASLSVMINIYYMLNDKFRLWNLLIIPCIILIIATGSRKAIIMLFLGVFGVLIFRYKNNTNFLNILWLNHKFCGI